jgi:hypothetical protein
VLFQAASRARSLSDHREELDKKIELWLADKWQCQVDFEINDALNKLLALKLVNETDGQLLYHEVDVAEITGLSLAFCLLL